MSFPSSISKSLFHQVTLIFIPGALVAIPFWMLIYMSFKNKGFNSLLDFYEHHTAFICFVLVIAIFMFGLILENIGSVIEEQLDIKFGISKKAWNSLLFNKCGDDNLRVIHKYMDSVVFRYKFELSLIPGWLLFLFQWCILFWIEYSNFSHRLFFSVLVISCGCLWFTLWQSNVSCVYLNRLRIEYMNYRKKEKEEILLCTECS